MNIIFNMYPYISFNNEKIYYSLTFRKGSGIVFLTDMSREEINFEYVIPKRIILKNKKINDISEDELDNLVHPLFGGEFKKIIFDFNFKIGRNDKSLNYKLMPDFTSYKRNWFMAKALFELNDDFKKYLTSCNLFEVKDRFKSKTADIQIYDGDLDEIKEELFKLYGFPKEKVIKGFYIHSSEIITEQQRKYKKNHMILNEEVINDILTKRNNLQEDCFEFTEMNPSKEMEDKLLFATNNKNNTNNPFIFHDLFYEVINEKLREKYYLIHKNNLLKMVNDKIKYFNEIKNKINELI